MSAVSPLKRKPSILVVASPSGCKVLRALLPLRGYRLREATGGEEAAALFAAGRPDLVLLDVAPPYQKTMRGYRKLARMARPAGVPMLAVCGATTPQVLEEVLRAGADDWLSPPFSAALFRTRVEQLLRRSGPAAGCEERLARLGNSEWRPDDKLRLLKEAVECLPLGITITDTSGRILYTNPAEARFHGYNVDELLGQQGRILAPERLTSPLTLEQIEQIGLWRRETVNLRKDGTEFPVQLSSIAVRNADGDYLGVITACEDITERKAAEQQIRQLAFFDALTGLPNRWMVQDRLQQAIAAAARDGRRVGLLFLDLDHFKDINDTQGHDFGDRLLREVAHRLAGCTREADTLGRLGGDEFVIVLTDVDAPQDITAAALRVLSAFHRPFELDGRQVYSSASIGIALFPDDGEEMRGLLQCADTAMYAAKGEGRQSYRFFSLEMNEALHRHAELQNGLRRALDRGEFRLHYQPQWDLRTQALTGVEALLRWDSPELGPVPPSRFVPQAERAGLIIPLGEWVLRTACAQAAAWLAAGMPLPKVAVNISGHQLRQPGFVSMVEAVLAETGLDPHRLDLECTESVLLEEPERAARTLHALRQRGIQISLDDFGTGYSSLSYLRHLPIDRIKIDRSFVADLSASPGGGAIVEALIALSRSLRLKVLAEGVETGDQLAFLQARQCDEVQGFYFAEPLAAEEVGDLLMAGGDNGIGCAPRSRPCGGYDAV